MQLMFIQYYFNFAPALLHHGVMCKNKLKIQEFSKYSNIKRPVAAASRLSQGFAYLTFNTG